MITYFQRFAATTTRQAYASVVTMGVESKLQDDKNGTAILSIYEHDRREGADRQRPMLLGKWRINWLGLQEPMQRAAA